jgi:hypothetical protein
MTRCGAERLANRWRPVSRRERMGPPPKGASRMAESLARMAQGLGPSSARERPATGDQDLGAGLRQRTDRPHAKPAGAAGSVWVG